MFSNKYSVNAYDVKSSLRTAIASVITTFALTPVLIYAHLMAFDYKFFVAPFVFGAVMFIWDLGQKFFRDGKIPEKEVIHELLDQNREKEHSVDS